MNPVTTERMTFLITGADSGGQLLRIGMKTLPMGGAPEPHVHPAQEERFEVLSGTATFRIRGRDRVCRAGESVTIPARVPHTWWNSGTGELDMLVEFRPAGRFEEFITSYIALARSGRAKLPRDILRVAVVLHAYRDTIHPALPLGLHRPVVAALAAIGRLAGHRADVPYR